MRRVCQSMQVASKKEMPGAYRGIQLRHGSGRMPPVCPTRSLLYVKYSKYTGFEALSRQRQFDIEPMSRNSTASNMIDDVVCGRFLPGEKDLYAASMPDVCLPIGCMPSICVVCLSKGDRLTQYAQSMSEYAGRLKERDARGIQGHTAAARKWSYASSMPDEILALREIQQVYWFRGIVETTSIRY